MMYSRRNFVKRFVGRRRRFRRFIYNHCGSPKRKRLDEPRATPLATGAPAQRDGHGRFLVAEAEGLAGGDDPRLFSKI